MRQNLIASTISGWENVKKQRRCYFSFYNIKRTKTWRFTSFSQKSGIKIKNFLKFFKNSGFFYVLSIAIDGNLFKFKGK